jgi:biopolymer transport protein ExbD
MNFEQRITSARRENVVPMINVVFLLLIFFMISSELSPPPPIEVAPPTSEFGDTARAEHVMYVDAFGGVVFGGEQGEAALVAIAERTVSGPLLVRADASLQAATLAKLLTQLSDRGVSDVELAVRIGGPQYAPR